MQEQDGTILGMYLVLNFKFPSVQLIHLHHSDTFLDINLHVLYRPVQGKYLLQ
jgi:hypothetical protein